MSIVFTGHRPAFDLDIEPATSVRRKSVIRTYDKAKSRVLIWQIFQRGYYRVARNGPVRDVVSPSAYCWQLQ